MVCLLMYRDLYCNQARALVVLYRFSSTNCSHTRFQVNSVLLKNKLTSKNCCEAEPHFLHVAKFIYLPGSAFKFALISLLLV